jgi:hypothetical protein
VIVNNCPPIAASEKETIFNPITVNQILSAYPFKVYIYVLYYPYGSSGIVYVKESPDTVASIDLETGPTKTTLTALVKPFPVNVSVS